MSNPDSARVSRLAVIAAQLSDPFADPNAVLAAHGYTREAWRREHDELVMLLARDMESAGRFEQLYFQATRQKEAPELSAAAPAAERAPQEVRARAPAPVPPLLTPTYLRPPDRTVATAPEETTLAPRSAVGPVLPFGGAPSAAFREQFARSQDVPCEPDPTGTLPIVLDTKRDGTLPFDLPPALALLRLDRYVALVAELRADPGGADAVMKRHGLVSAADRERVHGLWRTRLASSPELRERFERLVAERQARER